MKILHVYKTYYPDPTGGVQEVIRNICSTLVKMDVQNDIYTLSKMSKPTKVKVEKCNVYRGHAIADPASCELGGLQAFKLFSNLVSQVDLIQYHYPWPFQDLLNLMIKPSIPKVLCYHSDIVRQRFLGWLYEPLMWKTLKSVDCIVATSPHYAKSSVVLSDKRIKHKVTIIPLGIDEDTYSFEEDDTIFTKINVSKDEPYFLFVGVFRYYKGLKYLIEAAQQVNAKIVLAGSGFEYISIQEYANSLGLKNVIFAGQVTHAEKVSLIKNCRTFVLPSHLRSEAFGVVLIEAAMMQKPMISCDIGTGTSYVNAHELTGFVVKPAEANEIATAMNKLLRDPALAKKMGLAARERYLTLFSGEVLGREYKTLYQRLMNEKKL